MKEQLKETWYRARDFVVDHRGPIGIAVVSFTIGAIASNLVPDKPKRPNGLQVLSMIDEVRRQYDVYENTDFETAYVDPKEHYVHITQESYDKMENMGQGQTNLVPDDVLVYGPAVLLREAGNPKILAVFPTNTGTIPKIKRGL